jgi:hypothetical protein
LLRPAKQTGLLCDPAEIYVLIKNRFQDARGYIRFQLRPKYLKINILWVTVTYYSMKQSPSSETNLFSASQEVPHILWKRKVHYRNYKRSKPVPILSQSDLDHVYLPFRESISQLRMSLPSVLFPSVFLSTHNSSPNTSYMLLLSHSSRYDNLQNIW